MITCNICGKQEKPEKFAEKCAKNMLRKNLCFKCLFWDEKISIPDLKNAVRIDGDHFYIGLESSTGNRGYNGQRFKIKFFDGRKIITTNLWCQGKIPEYFRKLLPDNAEFVGD